MLRIGLGMLLGALALAAAPTERTIKGREFSYQIRSDVKEVETGHWVGPWWSSGICLDNVGQKDEEAGVMSSEGTYDGMWTSLTELKNCTSKGKTSCTFQDSSIRIEEWTATCTRDLGGFFHFEGRSVLVVGTGRFEGIKGSASWTSRQLKQPPGEITFTVRTTRFTLPKK
jgi:hypothetical protein